MEISQGLIAVQKNAETGLLIKCNDYSSHYGLTLSREDMLRLEDDRFKALERTERIEFGTGILPSLIYAFCDSLYIDSKNYTDTLSELQELFYEAKNRSCSLVSDEEMVGFMKNAFNSRAQGSTVLLSDMLDEMCISSLQLGRSAADCCDIEDFAYINHNSDTEGFENQTDTGDQDDG